MTRYVFFRTGEVGWCDRREIENGSGSYVESRRKTAVDVIHINEKIRYREIHDHL